jgi:HPt (histidine-containing phosphotransfer) domain-containing protein
MGMLDTETVAQLREDLPAEALEAILATFEADVARLTGELQASIEAGDAAAFHRCAHTLAGAAGAVGARQLAETARRCMAASTPEDRALVQPLVRVQARAAMAALRAEFGAG